MYQNELCFIALTPFHFQKDNVQALGKKKCMQGTIIKRINKSSPFDSAELLIDYQNDAIFIREPLIASRNKCRRLSAPTPHLKHLLGRIQNEM